MDLFRPKLISRFDQPADEAAAIRLVGSLLLRAGAVTEEHIEAAVQRERDYPTGLPAEVPFALVHTDAEGALETAAALGIFELPVAFRAMDDRSNILAVHLVVFLSMPERHQQAAALSELVKVLADGNIARQLLSASPAEALRLLRGDAVRSKAA